MERKGEGRNGDGTSGSDGTGEDLLGAAPLKGRERALIWTELKRVNEGRKGGNLPLEGSTRRVNSSHRTHYRHCSQMSLG